MNTKLVIFLIVVALVAGVSIVGAEFIQTSDALGVATSNQRIADSKTLCFGAGDDGCMGSDGTDIDITGSGTWTFSTAVTSSANNLGWSVVAGANTSCETTCTGAAVFGFDSGTTLPVGPADATADVCVCAAAS